MDYSSFVSVKSRHDCHEGMKDGNHSEGISMTLFFHLRRDREPKTLILTLFRAALQSHLWGDLQCAPNFILIFISLVPSEMYLENSLSEAEG